MLIMDIVYGLRHQGDKFSKRKAIGPSGPEKVDPTSDGWVEYLEEVEERRKLPRLEPPSRGRGRGRGGGTRGSGARGGRGRGG